MEHRALPSSSLLASATEDEYIVSQILLDLRTLMSLSESLSNFNWGRRRRRSYLEPPQPPAPLIAAPSWPAASPENGIEERRARTKAEDAAVLDEKHDGAARTTAASPDTPLSFFPSESDEKLKQSSKKSSKKRALKSGINFGMELTQHYRIPEPHHHPLDCQHTPGPITTHLQPSDEGHGFINNGGPLGIDLNLPAEEAFGVELYQPLDVSGGIVDKRAKFAEARRKRIGIMKTKSKRNY